MGQEIASAGFDQADFARFRGRLERETALLCEHHAHGRLSQAGPRIGLELEAWLVDRNYWPAPDNQSFLARINDPYVVAELSRFNIEVNCPPASLSGDGLGKLETHLASIWKRCVDNAHEDGDTVMAIGTLPTLRESDLSLRSMTLSNRYAALNEQLVRLRDGRPLRIDIDSHHADWEHLQTEHLDCMLEAATTSFQLHLQVPPQRISGTLNASMMLSGPLVALSANSPFLFGKPLWHETRIAIFEQAIEQVGDENSRHRVTFGSSYASHNITQIFEENLRHYPVLLPLADDDEATMPCLRLHNGTIWRWNRPLVGFDDDGTPHLRIEQRVMPAGPTIIDMLANAAFYYGATGWLAEGCAEPDLPFEVARANFYAAARLGLEAEMEWIGGEKLSARGLLAKLAPLAREGLRAQGVSESLIDRYMDIVDQRIARGQNGAVWQLAHYRKHGDVFALTADYLEHQRSGMPVHEWPV